MPNTSDRPNVVLMVSDDHGRDMATYGDTSGATPNLDALANGGVTFDNSYCTTASCAASRSVILTGLYNHTNGTFGHTHDVHHFSCFEDTVTLPALMNDAGYRTGRVGKTHYAPMDIFPFQVNDPRGGFGRDDVAMSESCREFVADGDDPFFLYWCSHNPHRGGGPIQDHPLKPDRFGNPDEPYPGDEEQLFNEDEIVVPDYLPDIPETRAELAQYYQSVARLDRGVGRLMQILRDTGQYDNTVIMYIADNGAAFPGAKTNLYEPGANLPLIVRTPDDANRGGRCDGLVTWADLTPTVIDYAGSSADPESFHGRSFSGIVDRASPSDWRDEIYLAHTFHEITNYYPMRIIRTKRHKFTYNIASGLQYSFAPDLWAAATWQGTLKHGLKRYGKRKVEDYLHRPKFELYDLDEDPDELVNLADKPKYKPLVDKFCMKLRAFQEDTKDPWLHKWEYE